MAIRYATPRRHLTEGEVAELVSRLTPTDGEPTPRAKRALLEMGYSLDTGEVQIGPAGPIFGANGEHPPVIVQQLIEAGFDHLVPAAQQLINQDRGHAHQHQDDSERFLAFVAEQAADEFIARLVSESSEEQLPGVPYLVYEAEDDVVVRLEVPGYKTEDINISTTREVLSISGTRYVAGTEADELHEPIAAGGGATQSEFEQNFSIAQYHTITGVEAKVQDGILLVTLKNANPMPRGVEISRGGMDDLFNAPEQPEEEAKNEAAPAASNPYGVFEMILEEAKRLHERNN